MTTSQTYYDLLGVSRTADASSLRKAFLTLSKALHPDTTSLPTDEAARRFHEVCEAYELLADPMLRAKYDFNLEQKIAREKTGIVEPVVNIQSSSSKTNGTEVRRPLSGGELFSLLLLGLVILCSLFISVGLAVYQGMDLQSLPSWLIV